MPVAGLKVWSKSIGSLQTDVAFLVVLTWAKSLLAKETISKLISTLAFKREGIAQQTLPVRYLRSKKSSLSFSVSVGCITMIPTPLAEIVSDAGKVA